MPLPVVQSAGRPRGRPPRVARNRTGSSILVPPPNYTLYRFLKTYCFNSRIAPLIQEYGHFDGKPPRHRVEEYLDFVRHKYLPYLEFDVSREKDLDEREEEQVRKALVQLSDPGNHLPHDVASEASRILHLFEPQPARSTTPPPSRHAITGSEYPPSDHPIWGDHGIMHGVRLARGAGGNPTYRPDERFPPRDARVHGHNGPRPGAWFARQRCAIARGAHANALHGIAGDPARGAHSVVVSGGGGPSGYDAVDRDEGDVLYYSAQGAGRRDAARQADARGNRALAASLRTGRPVRVLRSHRCSRRWAPPCGIRYDGLYRVVGTDTRLSKVGGVYRRFKLVREPDQPSLEEIMRESPTAQQAADYEQIRNGY